MNWASILQDVEAAIVPHRGKGRVADYIPAIATVDPMKFGMCVALACGEQHCLGSADERFSIQSISKVFTLSMALRKEGDALWQRVGREPSGSPFNSIVQLEHEQGIPRNPLINAGAIVVTDHLAEKIGAQAMIAELLDRLRMLTGDASVTVDEAVATSEASASARNAPSQTSCGHLRICVTRSTRCFRPTIRTAQFR